MHLRIWLTKRPATIAKLQQEIGGFPPNVCAMTTVTCATPDNLDRVEDMRRVKADVRGLPIDSLGERIHKAGGIVVVSEAYHEFLYYCEMESLACVAFFRFGDVAKELTLKKFRLGFRNDIRTPEGKQAHDWRDLQLLPDWCEPQGKVA